MKNLTTALVIVSITAVSAWSADRPNPPKRPGAPQAHHPGPEGRHAGHFLRGLRHLDLSEDQRKQLQEIMAAHREEVTAFREKNKNAHQALLQKAKAARESQDREAMQAVREEMKKLHEGAPKPEALKEKVLALLTDDQKKALKEGAGSGHRPVLLEGLELTNDQKKQIHQILSDHRKAMQAYFEKQRKKIQAIRSEARGSDNPEEARQAAHEKMKAIREGAPDFDAVAAKIRALLSADQVPTFEANLKKAQNLRKQRAAEGPRFKGPRDGRPDRRRPRPGRPGPEAS